MIFTMQLVRKCEVDIVADTVEDAALAVRQMHEGGDSCVEMGDATINMITSRFEEDE